HVSQARVALRRGTRVPESRTYVSPRFGPSGGMTFDRPRWGLRASDLSTKDSGVGTPLSSPCRWRCPEPYPVKRFARPHGTRPRQASLSALLLPDQDSRGACKSAPDPDGPRQTESMSPAVARAQLCLWGQGGLSRRRRGQIETTSSTLVVES